MSYIICDTDRNIKRIKFTGIQHYNTEMNIR